MSRTKPTLMALVLEACRVLVQANMTYDMPLNVQVKRAEQHLLEALYGHISSLGKFESDTLLEEDPDTMQRRAATRKVGLLLQPLLHSERSPAVGASVLLSWHG